jgi:hypothetical protein
MQNRLRQVAVLVFTLLCIGSSFMLGDSLDQGQPGDVTSQVYFLPFNLTFAIWGVIFLGALVYSIYQLLPGQAERPLHRRIGGWLALNAALTAAWNVTARQSRLQNEVAYVVLTVFILFGMLACLTRVYILLRQHDAELTRRDRWLVQVPATLFFAWLNVAAIANTAAALAAIGFTGEPYGAIWAIAMLIIAAALAAVVILYSRVSAALYAYSGVIVWAAAGIMFNNLQRAPAVAVTCVLVALWVIGVTLFRAQRENRPGAPAGILPKSPQPSA